MSRRLNFMVSDEAYDVISRVANAKLLSRANCLVQLALEADGKIAKHAPKPPKPKSMQQRKREVDAFMKSPRGQLWVECGAVANYTNIWRDYDIRTGDVRLSDRDKFLDHVERVGIKAWREAHLAGDLFDPTA